MEEFDKLEALQLDALKEVANIGAGHAATALSQLTERRIMISVPQINVTGLEGLSEVVLDPDEIVAAVLMQMLGDLTGRTLLMLPEANAKLLCDLLLRRPPGTTESFEDLEKSSLKEAGNILGGAYMNALSDFMGMMLLPSVPSLAIDVASAVITSAQLGFGHDWDHVFCVETDFHFEEAGRKLKGHFLLLPDLASLKAILGAIQLT
ncbi:MAG: chemotaxis protein CheC [Gemmatimonadota bacterium]|nr:MAG: chemotaxis protein CheC [Gemmatimonadota bacterium]